MYSNILASVTRCRLSTVGWFFDRANPEVFIDHVTTCTTLQRLVYIFERSRNSVLISISVTIGVFSVFLNNVITRIFLRKSLFSRLSAFTGPIDSERRRCQALALS